MRHNDWCTPCINGLLYGARCPTAPLVVQRFAQVRYKENVQTGTYVRITHQSPLFYPSKRNWRLLMIANLRPVVCLFNILFWLRTSSMTRTCQHFVIQVNNKETPNPYRAVNVNIRQLECLFDSFVRLRTKKISKLHTSYRSLSDGIWFFNNPTVGCNSLFGIHSVHIKTWWGIA